MTLNPDENLNTKQAAAFLGVEPNTLECWRSLKRYDLKFVRVGRLIKYRRSDLLKWMDARTEGGSRE